MQGAELISLPECANSVNLAGEVDDYHTQANDPFLTQMQNIASRLNVNLHLGSLILRDEDSNKCCNRGFFINRDGAIIADYDKIHLFDVNLAERQYRESDKFIAGNKIKIAETEFGKFGITICFDLRFPALYERLALKGAWVVTVPAAFTATTGRAHWHSLLRARAIENGIYIIAAAQVGHHEDGRRCWGHSMIIDPWGEILAALNDEPNAMILADIKAEKLQAARYKIPRLQQIQDFD